MRNAFRLSFVLDADQRLRAASLASFAARTFPNLLIATDP